MSSLNHHYQDIIAIFSHCFEKKYNTKLILGEEEPLYLPAHNEQTYHAIYFAHGFFSSALHECAHWLVAGQQRRQEVDYGYWYIPEGRTVSQQQQFQQVEIKPQALEWVLSRAACYPFHVSFDNLSGVDINIEPFKKAIYQQVQYYCQQGLPRRAKIFRDALCDFYQTPTELCIEQFDR